MTSAIVEHVDVEMIGATHLEFGVEWDRGLVLGVIGA